MVISSGYCYTSSSSLMVFEQLRNIVHLMPATRQADSIRPSNDQVFNDGQAMIKSSMMAKQWSSLQWWPSNDQVFNDGQHNSWSCNDFWWEMTGSLMKPTLASSYDCPSMNYSFMLLFACTKLSQQSLQPYVSFLYRVSNQIMKGTSWLQASDIMQFQKTSKGVPTATSLTMHLTTTPSLATLNTTTPTPAMTSSKICSSTRNPTTTSIIQSPSPNHDGKQLNTCTNLSKRWYPSYLFPFHQVIFSTLHHWYTVDIGLDR